MRSRTRVRAYLRGKAPGNLRGEIFSYFVGARERHVCSVTLRARLASTI